MYEASVMFIGIVTVRFTGKFLSSVATSCHCYFRAIRIRECIYLYYVEANITAKVKL